MSTVLTPQIFLLPVNLYNLRTGVLRNVLFVLAESKFLLLEVRLSKAFPPRFSLRTSGCWSIFNALET